MHEQVDEVQIPGRRAATSACCPGTRRCWPRCRSASCGTAAGQEKTYLAIVYGFAEVLPDRVTILAQLAEQAEDIDVERAEASRTRAAERLEQKADPPATSTSSVPALR